MSKDDFKAARVPEDMIEAFAAAEDKVKAFYAKIEGHPNKGRIEIDGVRYMWANAEALGVSFREILEEQFGRRGTDAIVYSFGKSLGKTDAKRFHERFNLKDPVEKLSAGPVYFSYSGWAFVDILPQSAPQTNENYVLTYHHPNSFEAEAFRKRGKETDRPICFINAGYSAGWCEESFGVPLEARELSCVARGDEHCTFLMTHKDKINYRVKIWREKTERGEEITVEDLLSV